MSLCLMHSTLGEPPQAFYPGIHRGGLPDTKTPPLWEEKKGAVIPGAAAQKAFCILGAYWES